MRVQDEQFGMIVDYEDIRQNIHKVYDYIYPEYNLLAATRVATEYAEDDPSISITVGASALAYSILIAAEEYELAAQLKDKIFTLGWTEEHCGSDLLSIRTQATPMSDDPNERNFHIKGSKWLINCSFHADYHLILAKTDPNQDGPRSLSFFLVPQSSCKNWERLETHVLRGMVLTKFDIDGPGVQVGKLGHGLSIIQRMALPSKYQCTSMGVRMLHGSIPAAVEWLGEKRIFGSNPLQFSNVFRQMYDITLKGALYDFMFFRAAALNENGFLQFHGTTLKSFLLLRINEVLSKNWLTVGSKGFVAQSVIGRDAIDSFVLPVFDGHYTINTLMTAKHADRYLGAELHMDMEEQLHRLSQNLYEERPGSEIEANPKEVRKPPFFSYAGYLNQFGVPLPIDWEELIQKCREITDEIEVLGLGSEPEYRYKTGELIHWLESLQAACELWKLTHENNYLNTIVIQYNGVVNHVNTIISEGSLSAEFMLPARQVPISGDTSDPVAFLKRLLNVRAMVRQMPAMSAGD